MVEGMEQQQILATERERIGRDLHDGAIQLVYTAGLLVESARTQAPPETPLASRLDRAVTVLNDAVTALRRNLGELRPAPSAATLLTAFQAMAGRSPVCLVCGCEGGVWPFGRTRLRRNGPTINTSMRRLNVVRHADARRRHRRHARC
jgi:hypothetical protein